MNPHPRRESLKVLLIADDPLVRAGLLHVIETDDDAPESTLEVAVALGVPPDPGAVQADATLIDLGVDPVAAAQRLRELNDRDGVVLVLVPEGLDAEELLGAGVKGALPRSADGAMIRAAMRAVSQGLIALDPSLARTVPRRSGARAEPATRAHELTPREHEVLQLLAEALPNKLIADRLGISDHTAKFHVNSVLSKLAAGTRTEAVVRAARLGIVTL